MVAATDGSAGAFTATMTASCGPRSAGLSLAGSFTVIAVSGVSTVRPLARIAARCAPRATTETSMPPLAR